MAQQEQRTGKYGTPRLQYLQELVSQFQNSTDEGSVDYLTTILASALWQFDVIIFKCFCSALEIIVANLANFAYDPFNYTILRQLNVLELFLDCITEPNEKLVEFGIGGICNVCAEPKNAAIIVEADEISLMTNCELHFGGFNRATREEIVRGEVVDLIERYAAAETVSVSFSNLAKAFLDKHVHANT
ncbi:unnamed protein product [Thlaspi arvense]|uniref:Armadillo repeat-containing protein 7 n=1 Tax=Thlaspi arvense TaxID=13288 RepID=A0AAU9SG75_THLAR|nr:unnamed protein product [Thlaspi arvense]